jgi:phenylacetic acid degradation operon negative regulatory protein
VQGHEFVTTSFEDAAQAVIRTYRRQRPLRAGSLIITLFGDAIAPRGGTVSLASLITLMASFGLTDRLVRTAVGRLAQAGWLAAEREGRLSYYGLTRLGRKRFVEATRRIYSVPPADWRGRWTLVLAKNGAGHARQKLRSELEWFGFGQLASGTFAHPDTDMDRVRRELTDPSLLDGALVLSAESGEMAADRRLIERGWDLKELERRYRRFVALFTPVLLAANAKSTHQGKASLAVRTLLIHEYRRVHLRDPLLPHSLLPQDWAGAAAYELCRSLYGLVYRSADRYLGELATTRYGALPAPAAELDRRFGRLHGSFALGRLGV